MHIYVAKQIQVTYNLNYDGNGGGGIHGTQTGYSTGTANTSMKLNRMAAPTAPVGYTFGGWNTEADGSGNTYNAGTTFQPTSNTVYYAKWIPIPYSVSFNGNGATSGSMVNQSFTFDEVKALSANQFKREYTVTFDANGGSVSATTATAAATFNGWEDRGSIVYNGKTYSYNGSESDRTRFDAPYYVQPFANPPKSKDVYDDAGCGNGHYNKYGLVGHFVNHGIKEYYTDGSVGRKPAPTSGETPGLYPDRATVSHLTTTKDYTVPLYANWTLGSVTLPEPKWDGHKFLGWYSGDDYVGDSGDTYTPAANVTLTAKWETDTYTVTYNANGGSGAPDDQIKTHGVDLTLSSTEPTRTGHTFEGWNTKADGNGTAYAPGAAYKANENLTLYAQWSQNLTLTNGYDGYLYRNDAGAASYRWTRRQGSYNVDQTDWSDTWEAVDPDAISGNKVDVYADGGYVHESGNYHTGTKWEYKVEALDSEGKVIGEATYVVNFGDQILNGSFENPGVTPNSQSGFANDHENLFWRSSVENQYADGNPWDVELVYTNNTYNFGHKIAAHMDQFAEINANTEAALYQDVLTTPGENLTWSLSHTARILGDMTNATDTMYVLIASSQTAHLITTQEQLDVLIQAAEASTADGALNGEVDLTASGVTYRIWKLTSDFIDQETWTVYAGQYSVPAGQKMTRFFFAAGETASGNGSNGNLIDNVSFDRDVHYVINYYVNGEHMVSMTESGTGLPGATVSPGKINDLTKDNYASLIGVYLNNDKVDGTDLLLSNERANVLDLYFLTNHTVTYQYTGTVPSDATALPEPETYRYGDTVTVAGAASAQGYTFSGWSRTGSFTISGDVTITGSFNAKNDGWYVVHYYRSGTTTSVCDSKKVEGLTYGSIHTEEAPTVTGYTVSGEARKTVTALYGNNEIIFYYTPNAYTVTYDGNGVEGPAGSQYDITQQITLAGVLSQNGYNFKGWMVKESVGNWTKGTVYAAGTTIEAGKYGDVTLVAQWEKITYTVTYDENGGNYVADATYTVTDSFNLAKPTRDGYDFLGWKLASNTGSWSAGTYTAGQTIGTGNYGNVTLVAQWQRQTGSLTITKSGEDVAEDQTFIFKIKGEGIEMEVVIQGANSVTIQGLPTGSYTVTEDTTWSWRYTPDAGTSIQTSSVTDGEIVSLTFHNTKTNSNWFNAMAWIKNFFGMPAE